jgi:hypothetical protein
MRLTMHRILVTVVLVISCSAGTAAQNVEQAPSPAQNQTSSAATQDEGNKPTRGFVSALVHNLTNDLKHMPTMTNAYWLVGGGAAALLVRPDDRRINRHLVGSHAADVFYTPGKYTGNTGVLLGAATAAYVIGRTKNKPRAEHIGMDEIEALALAEGIGHTVKFIVRRDRPVDLFTGEKRNGYSFPGGHATVTFAFATVLARHFGNKAAIPTYLLASYVATSRLHDNRHYASDVVFGAAMGIAIGRAVTFHGRTFWGGPTVVPTRGGFAVLFTKPRAG